jgi:hypothetical protein
MYEIIGPNHTYFISHTDVALFTLAIVWELIWKGIGLYKAGTHKQLGWFIAMLVLNTAGLLEIVYLLFFQAKHTKKSKSSEES